MLTAAQRALDDAVATLAHSWKPDAPRNCVICGYEASESVDSTANSTQTSRALQQHQGRFNAEPVPDLAVA